MCVYMEMDVYRYTDAERMHMAVLDKGFFKIPFQYPLNTLLYCRKRDINMCGTRHQKSHQKSLKKSHQKRHKCV